MKTGYRREIDGLRAVAVLPVIFYHAGIAPFHGGYVGVDVFFVISGYLITSILVGELEAGEFSLLRFYERRARRILPALFLVLAVTALAGVALLLPFELRDLGHAIASVVLFASNFLFWRQDVYFAAASDLNPLIHTWSLAVEEQFYIFFPPVLWGLWRLGRPWVWSWVGLAFLTSLLLAEFLSERSTGANFFLLPSRGWELMAGAAGAIWASNHAPVPKWLGELLGAGGLAAILFAILAFDEGTPFPSLWALIPVLGTLAVLLGASPATLAGQILSWRGLVGIGLISYSAYLWHQPLFAFARLTGTPDELPLRTALPLTLTTLVLAWMSWAFVERPFRDRSRLTRHLVFGLSGGGSAVLLSVAGVFALSAGLPQRFPEKQRPWIAQSPLQHGEYVRERYRKVSSVPLQAEGRNLVIVGDSFSQDVLNIIAEKQAFEGMNISAIYVPAICQIHYGLPAEEVLANVAPQDRGTCAKRQLVAEHIEMLRKADIVVFASRWSKWSAESFAKSLEAMALPRSVRVLVFGPKIFEENRRELLTFDPAAARQQFKKVPDDILETNAILHRSVPAGSYVDIIREVCAGNTCPLFDSDGQMISYDGRHLTREGARYIGEKLFAALPLSAFARKDAAAPPEAGSAEQ